MRWYVEKGEGSGEFVCMVFEDADVEISSQAGLVEKLSFGSPDEALEAMEERVALLREQGYVISVHPEDRFKPDLEIQRWWEESFEEELLACNNAQKRAEPRGLVEALEAERNVRFSPDLRRFLELRDAYSFGWTNYGEWRIWDQDLDEPDTGAMNRFEKLILQDQGNYLGTAMTEAFIGGVFLGTAGNGDSYFAIPDDDPGRSEVVIWDHETADVTGVIADSVTSFAYLNHAYRLHRDCDGGEDLKVLQEAVERVAPRVDPSWHYSSMFSDCEVTPEYESESSVRYYFWRLLWVNYLLRQDGVVDVSDIEDMFPESIHGPLKFEDFRKEKNLETTPITQFYWLWRLFWFDHKEDLQTMLAIAKKAPSPLVRDCAALIEEFENGRATIGTIEDIHALRYAFLELDLDPARSEDREREAAEEEARAASELAEKLGEVSSILASGDLDRVMAAAFENVQFPEVLEEIYAYLQTVRPEIAAGEKLHDFLVSNGASRNHCFYEFEGIEVGERLAQTPGMLPLLIQGQSWEAVGMSRHPRALEFLLPVLNTREKYHHRLAAAVDGLVAGNYHEHSAQILAGVRPLVLELRWDEDDYAGEIRNKGALRAVIEAVGMYAQDREDLAELQEVIESGPGEVLIPALKAASEASARLGAEPEFLYEALATLLEGGHERAACSCYALLGTGRALESVREALEIQCGAPANLAFERVMAHWLAVKHGESVDLDLVQLASGVIEANKFEDVELHLALLELLKSVEDADFVRALLWKYANHDQAQVRRRAVAALEALGAQPVFAHRVYVDEVAEARGIEGLTELLLDSNVLWKHNVLRKGVELGVSAEFVAAAAQAVKEICYFTHYTNNYASYYHNTIYYTVEAAAQMCAPEVDRVLGEILNRSNTMYAKPLGDGAVQRLKTLDPTATKQESVSVTVLGDACWFPGGTIHGLASNDDSTRFYAATSEQLFVMDDEGRVIGRGPRGWMYDVQLRDHTLAVSGHSGFFALLDATTLEVLHQVEQSGAVRKARFSPNGLLVATVTDYRNWSVIDVASGAILNSDRDQDDINGVDWLDDETFVVCTDTSIVVFNVQGTELARVRSGGAAEVRVRADGEIFVGIKQGIQRYDRALNPVGDLLKQVCVARMEFRGKELIAASHAGSSCGVWSWDLAKGKRKRIKGHEAQGVFGLCLSADGRIFAGGSLKVVMRWDAKDKLIPYEISGHTQEIRYIGEGRGNTVLTVSDDQTVVEWDLENNAVVATFGPFDFRTCAAKWAVDGSALYICGTDNVVAVAPDGSELWRSTVVQRAEYLEIYEDCLVVASDSALVWLDRHTGALLERSPQFADSFIFRWVRLDNETLLCAGYDDTKLFEFNLATRSCTREISLGGGKDRLRFLNRLDSNRVVYTRGDNTLTVLNVQTGKPERVLKQSLDAVAADAESGRIYAWSGAQMFVLESDGTLHEPVETLAPNRVQVVHGKLIVGTTQGAVAAIEIG